MKLLITGATGFIGRNLLLRALASQRWQEVIAPVRNPEKLFSLLAMEGRNKPPSTLRVLRSTPESWGGDLECDAAVHCAGILFGRSETEYHSANLSGTLALLHSLPSSAKVVLLSSQSAGGPTPRNCEIRDEDTPDEPITLYGKSKKEMEVCCLSNFADREILLLRPPMVLGARDQATLPLFRLASGVLRPKPGWIPKRYSFLAVDDLCSAIFTTLERDTKTFSHRIYYVCHPESISDCDLIECAGNLLGRKGWVLPLPQTLVRAASALIDAVPSLRKAVPSLTRDRAREIWPDRWVVSGQRFEKAFGFDCKIGLTESLSHALHWYRKTGILRNS